jgi:hypothetical protein
MQKRSFGGMWNRFTYNFEVIWYDRLAVHIERPFASKVATLSQKEATQLRDALNEFLGETD